MTHLQSLLAASAVLALGACGNDTPPVRQGPQAVHPSPSALAQNTPLYGTAPAFAASGTAPSDVAGPALNGASFAAFCTGISDALQADGGVSRPASDPHSGGSQSGLIAIYGAAAGLECSVGNHTKGPTLVEGGRISRS